MAINIDLIDFNKNENGLVPVVIQDEHTLQVLMLGYMDKQAVEQTLLTKKVTFYSRSKNRLWVKGETSENYLILKDIFLDCDNDTILVLASPCGPTCHTGDVSCFGVEYSPALSSVGFVDKIIQERIASKATNSYTNQLIERGLNKVAQKVGEEAVEVVIAALAETKEEYLGEMTDLFYHALVLLHAKGLHLSDVAQVINMRHKNKTINP